MRVSDNQRFRLSENRVNQAKASNTGKMVELTTQKRINRVSDDPVGLGRVIKNRAALSDIGQYKKNIEFTKGYIERTESSLQGISDFLIRAKELSISLANGTYAEDSRKAAGEEIGEIIDGVVGLANTQYNNRYVFGGFRTQTPPVSHDGNFLGDDGVIFLQVDRGVFRKINIQARELFEPSASERGAGRFGMVQTLKIFEEGLLDDNIQMIRKAMDELDLQMEKVTNAQAILGGIHSGIDNTLRRLEISDELTNQEISTIEDSDTFEAISNFKKTEDILQSTLMASNKLLQPSLLNFMQ
ncbi:MAG: flagellar hook-associated protein FlgL [Pseudobacteriovorax sp.]|nr:flagellar hook-associated protein FlgL [Pseudobacteriovorax sp.]